MKVCLDSRLIQKGDYFVPVIGENFDGHDYIDKAMNNGAVGVIEEDELYRLAKNKLREINPKVIAVTGSVGKTTVTNYLYSVLSYKFKVCLGSLNTKLGLATNIINELNESDEYFVAEAGMDYVGELTMTGKLIEPDLVVLTNISESHIGKLGSIEAITSAKFELIDTIKKNGVVVLNWDNQHIREGSKLIRSDIRVIKYGLNNSNSDLDFSIDSIDINNIKLIGMHNILNMIGVVAVCSEYDYTKDEVTVAASEIKNYKGRMSLIPGLNGSIIIDDTYNSSRESSISAIDTIQGYYEAHNLDGRKIVVLGGMLELGEYEDKAHKVVGDYIAKADINIVCLVGELANKYLLSKELSQKNSSLVKLPDVDTAIEFIKTTLKPQKDDIILVKASQGIRLEKIVKGIMENPDDAKDLLVRQDERWA